MARLERRPLCPYCRTPIKTFYDNFAYYSGMQGDGDSRIVDCPKCGGEFKVVLRVIIEEYYEIHPVKKPE